MLECYLNTIVGFFFNVNDSQKNKGVKKNIQYLMAYNLKMK